MINSVKYIFSGVADFPGDIDKLINDPMTS